jgi:hypothetical protein
MAGRDISVTHVALGTIRVMNTCGMMGEVVGMAAAICKERSTSPRGVYKEHLAELKKRMVKGVSKVQPGPPRSRVAGGVSANVPKPPTWIKTAGANLARKAKVTVSSCLNASYKASNINDGKIAFGTSDRWVSKSDFPQTVELTWDSQQTISVVRIVTGWKSGARIIGMLEDFSLQYHDGEAWKDIPSAKASGNKQADWTAKFNPLKTKRLRLTITAALKDLARIWEIETYNPPVIAKPH